MYALITVKSTPEGDVEFWADLPPGFLGPAIGRALQQMVELGRLVQFTKIRKVLLHSDSSLTGETITLIEEDVVPGGLCVTAPKLDVLCDWPKEDEPNELDQAFEKAGIQFGEVSVKPIVSCLTARTMALAAMLPRTTGPSVPPLVQKELSPEPPKRLKVYLTSANAEEYRGGDADYMKSLVEGLQLIGVDAVRLVNTQLPAGDDQFEQVGSGKLIWLDYYEGLRAEQKRVFSGKLSAEQKASNEANFKVQAVATVQCMLRFFQKEMQENPDIIPILHIQSRLPGSGNAFQSGAAIQAFEQMGVKVFVTVHEWLYNTEVLKKKDAEEGVLGPTRQICQAATGTVFVNDLDEQAATIKGSTFIPIPITVAFETIDVDDVLNRPIRILMFGMLRPNKGFEQAADLAKSLLIRYIGTYNSSQVPKDQLWCVRVVGKLHESFQNFETLVETVYGPEIYGEAFPQPGWVSSTFQRLQDDDVFNAEISRCLAVCDRLRAEKYLEVFRRNRNAAVIVAELDGIERVLKDKTRRLALNNNTTGEWLKTPANRTAREEFSQALRETWENLSIQELVNFDLDASFALLSDQLREQYSAVAEKARCCEAVNDSACKFARERLKTELEPWLRLPLPVFFDLNLSEPALIDVFRQCKYVYKPDDKGMADNASAMISPMANGCILFTKWGHLTPVEFLEDQPDRQRIQTPERFKLDLQGRYSNSIVLSGRLNAKMSPSEVIEAIYAREADNNAANRLTLASLKHITEHRYLPIMIAARHVIYYRRILELDQGKIVVPRKEHQ